jgi:hypothetical protein
MCIGIGIHEVHRMQQLKYRLSVCECVNHFINVYVEQLR